jgi:DNA-binding CsgD family transcriptional regulator
MVAVLDDIQWADPPSLLLLEHLVRDPTPGRLLVLATYRESESPPLTEIIRQSAVLRVMLVGLTCDDVRHQLAAITGRGVPAELARRMHELTGGNPFFVGELARNLNRPGTPMSVRAAIEQRTGELSSKARDLLRMASIVGNEFSVARLVAIAGLPRGICLGSIREMMAAGLIEPTEADGSFRFVHALTRDAVDAGLPSETRAQLHRKAATVIETLHAGWIEPYLSDLARHWAAAAVEGERAVAARWAERAGDEAIHRLAYEEAARLYGMALDTGADEIDDAHRFRLLLSMTRALHLSGQYERTRETSARAAAVARRLRRPDLAAEAVLVVECTTALAWDRALRRWCAEALADLGPEPTGIRAKVLGRLAETEVYVADLTAAANTSRQALVVAERCGEPDALIAALRARHIVCSGPSDVAERDELAGRLLQIGWDQESPATRMSAHWWRIDARFACGDLAGVAAELEQLAWCTAQVGGPVARWSLLRYQGALAQARGDFAAARRHADDAFAAIEPTQHPAALPIRLAILGAIGHHVGVDPRAPQVMAVVGAGPGSTATPGHAFLVMDYLGPAFQLAEAGHITEAAAKFRALGPVEAWHTPHFYQLPLYALGVLVGIRVGDTGAIRALRQILTTHRGRHVVPGTEVTSYLGPVELYIGKASRCLGDLDAAVGDLDAAASIARASGAAGFLVEAEYELAEALAHRHHQDDLRRARSIITECAQTANTLGMVPFRTALEGLASGLGGTGGCSPLTQREDAVAALVARGLTNRQIAAELHISERTAQNHVQHILSKLDFANRSQIAAWVTEVRAARK